MMQLLHYVRQMRRITKTQMSEILGCSRYRLSRLEDGQSELYLKEWLNLLNWLKKAPIFSEDGFYMGDESSYLPKPAKALGVLHSPLSTIFMRHLDESSLSSLPEVINEFQIPESYFSNLANPLPGIVALRLLQKLVSKEKLSFNHDFLKLSVEHNFLDPDVLNFGNAEQKGRHFCQQWSQTKMVDCQFKLSADGLAELWVECHSDLLIHIIFKDQVLSHLSVDYLEDMIKTVIGERLSFVKAEKRDKYLLHFRGWCRR